MKMKDIKAAATKIVSTYIGWGYTLSETMSGHQGELLKVDLTNGTEIIRVLIDDRRHYFDMLDEVAIEIRRYVFGKDIRNEKSNVWSNQGELIAESIYYKLARYSDGDWYTDNKDEADSVQAIKEERREIRFSSSKSDVYTDDKRKALVLGYVRKQPRCKSKKASDIESVVKYGNTYRINMRNGNVYTLH